MKQSTYLYFMGTVLLVLATICLVFRPFRPFPLISLEEEAFGEEETYALQKIPKHLKSAVKMNLKPLAPESAAGKTLSASFIKSSFQTCWDGSKCSLSMLSYVLSRGTRFVDFEIFFSEGDLFVANGGNKRANTEFAESPDVLLLTEVFSALIRDAFSSTHVPNAQDPLIVHLRIQVDEKNAEVAASKIAALIRTQIGSRRMRKELTSSTTLKDAMKNVIILADGITAPWLRAHDSKSSGGINELAGMIHGRTGSSSFPLLKDKTTASKSGGSGTILSIAVPAHESSSSFIHFWSGDSRQFTLPDFLTIHMNILAAPFYRPSANLDAIETLFSKHQSAFVDMDSAERYIHRLIEV